MLNALQKLKPAHEEWAHVLNLLQVFVRTIASNNSRTPAGKRVSGVKNSYTPSLLLSVSRVLLSSRCFLSPFSPPAQL